MSHRESTFLLDLDVGDLDADLTGVGAAIEAAASPAARDGDADQADTPDLPDWVFDPELDGAVMATDDALKTPGMFFVGPCCAGACLAKGVAAHNTGTPEGRALHEEIIRVFQEGVVHKGNVDAARKRRPPVPTISSGRKREPKLAMKQQSNAARRPRTHKLLVDTHSVSTAELGRRQWLLAKFLWVRTVLAFCIDSCMAILSCSLKDIYARRGDRHPPMIEQLELRRLRKTGDRAQRGLVPLEELAGLPACCSRDPPCCADVAPRAPRALWERYERAASIEEENDALAAHLWCAGLGRTTGLCDEYLVRVTGAGRARVSRLRALATAADGVLSAGGGDGERRSVVSPRLRTMRTEIDDANVFFRSIFLRHRFRSHGSQSSFGRALVSPVFLTHVPSSRAAWQRRAYAG